MSEGGAFYLRLEDDVELALKLYLLHQASTPLDTRKGRRTGRMMLGRNSSGVDLVRDDFDGLSYGGTQILLEELICAVFPTLTVSRLNETGSKKGAWSRVAGARMKEAVVATTVVWVPAPDGAWLCVRYAPNASTFSDRLVGVARTKGGATVREVGLAEACAEVNDTNIMAEWEESAAQMGIVPR